MTHVRAISISGLVWLTVGLGLLYKGLHLLVHCFEVRSYGWPVAELIMRGYAPEQAVLVLVCVGLFLGLLKGRMALAKSVRRVTDHVLRLNLPLSLSSVFPKSYLILIGFMMCLGMGMKFLPITDDWRGIVDVAVGSALMNGAMLYFRNALSVHSGVYR